MPFLEESKKRAVVDVKVLFNENCDGSRMASARPSSIESKGLDKPVKVFAWSECRLSLPIRAYQELRAPERGQRVLAPQDSLRVLRRRAGYGLLWAQPLIILLPKKA